jgi:hypothetical protein
MDDFSYGSGWQNGIGNATDYSISPYSSGYSNTGFQTGSYTGIDNGGAGYGGSTNYGFSSNPTNSGWNPDFGPTSGFSIPQGNSGLGDSLTPYASGYSNQGLIPREQWKNQGLLTDAMRNNYGGRDSGGNYIPYPSNYYQPLPAPSAPSAPSAPYNPYSFDGYNSQGFNPSGIDRQGYNSTGFNSRGLDRGGLNTQGLRYDTAGKNYTDGGFNYDSGKIGNYLAGADGAAMATGDPTSGLSKMTNDDLRKRGSDKQTQYNVDPILKGALSGLSGLFNKNQQTGQSPASSIASLFAGGGSNGAQAQANAMRDAANAQVTRNNGIQDQQIATLNSMYGQDSPYAQAMRQQLDRKDAAAGRRSQYGSREVELQAKLAELDSRNRAQILGSLGSNSQANVQALGQANTLGNAAQTVNAQRTNSTIDLLGGLSGLFKGIGNSSGSNRDPNLNYNYGGTDQNYGVPRTNYGGQGNDATTSYGGTNYNYTIPKSNYFLDW